MSKVVLDASAILAVLEDEPGAEQVMLNPTKSVVSAVNFAEVQGKLVDRGMPDADATGVILRVVGEIHTFDLAQAAYAGSLIAKTKSLGLSLGDRCCLALAAQLKIPVYTTDKSWRTLDLGFPIHVIR